MSKTSEEMTQILLTAMKTSGDMKAVIQYLYNSLMSWNKKENVNGIEWNSGEVSKVIYGISQYFENSANKPSLLIQPHTIQGNTKPMSLDTIILQLIQQVKEPHDKNLTNAINQYLKLTKSLSLQQNQNTTKNTKKDKKRSRSEMEEEEEEENGDDDNDDEEGEGDDSDNNRKKRHKKKEINKKTHISSQSNKKKKNNHTKNEQLLPKSKKIKTNHHTNNNSHHHKKLESDIYAGESEDDSMAEDENIPSCNQREKKEKEKKEKEKNNHYNHNGKEKGNTHHAAKKGDAKLFEMLKLIKNGSIKARGGDLKGRDEEKE